MDMKLGSRPISAGSQRVALVTGGTGGIGAAVALQLAEAGDRVVIVGRDADRGAQMLDALRRACPNTDHNFLSADLSLLGETARVADEITALTGRLDAMVFCAGILSTIPEWTSENLERNFVLNYLTRYLLARRLLPLLSANGDGRIVLVSNAGLYPDTLDFEDLQYRHGKPGLKVSGRTQFANDLLAVELAERVRGTGIAVTCVFPGFVRTGVFDNARGLPFFFRFVRPLIESRAVTPETAAVTPVYLARAPEAAVVNGRFYGPAMSEKVIPARALRPERRSGLWSRSQELVRGYLMPGDDDQLRLRRQVGA
jgi:NAD(P)-dependent dehydrogenase (short-subunit alcohol dehydrogenase family)